MLNIYYINLDSAIERRIALEKNLNQIRASGITINRIHAFDANYIQQHQVPGSIRSTEKACFLSHIKAIEMSLLQPGPALIIEDDISLGSQSISQIQALIDKVGLSIDLLFAEICISSLPSMFQLYMLKRELLRENKIEVLQTQLFDFAGATAYILNHQSKSKLLKMMQKIKSFDLPYDLVLKQLILNGTISSGFIFPFVATLTSNSLNTDIQLAADELPNVVYHSFRKLMYLDAQENMVNYLNDLEKIPHNFYSQEDLVFGKIVSTIMSEKFPISMF